MLFVCEVDDVVDECKEVEIARMKLNWWREEIQRLFHDVPSHPVTKALTSYIGTYNLAEEYFQEIIDGMEMDLEQNHYSDFKSLSLYCYRAASVVGILSVEIFGYKDRNTLKYAHDLGMAFQLTNILRDVREDADRNRIYIPADELEQFGVKTSALTQGKTTTSIQNLLAYQAQRARCYYQSAKEQLPDVDRYAQRTGLIMSAIYETILDEIEDDGFRVLEHRISIPALRKIWIAWHTARKIKKK